MGVLLVALAIYLVNGLVGVVSPDSAWGIGYGIASTALLLAALAYPARRRTLSARTIGPSRTYLLIHLYGGTLFLVLALMHSGFGMPQAPLTWILWLLAIWVVGTGVLGVLIQKWGAASLGQLTTEVQLVRIPELVDQTRAKAEDVARNAGGLLADLYASELAGAMHTPIFRWRSFAGFVDDQATRFEYVRAMVPPERHESLDALRRLVRAKAEMDVHFALQTVLRKWLWVHVPTAVMLAAVLGLHIFVTLYY
ncbi:MAG: hypothetical protein OEO23_08720 [Gemmatimonadota bacterium]|nr:hypothetical protein [Gemmatimonadota bacterium]